MAKSVCVVKCTNPPKKVMIFMILSQDEDKGKTGSNTEWFLYYNKHRKRQKSL